MREYANSTGRTHGWYSGMLLYLTRVHENYIISEKKSFVVYVEASSCFHVFIYSYD